MHPISSRVCDVLTMGIFHFLVRGLRKITHAAEALGLLIAVSAAPGIALANQAPVIDGFGATPTTVAPGGTVDLSVAAHDPDCAGTCTDGCGLIIRSDLTLWSATGGSFGAQDNGISGSPYLATAQWLAPMAEDVYTIQVELADSGTFLCGGRQTTTATVLVTVTSTNNQAPVVTAVTADPGRLYPGEVAQLNCVADDPDGDVLSYEWSTDAGTVTPGSGSTADFTSVEPAVATVTCVATDPHGAAGMGSVVVSVSDVSALRRISDGLTSPQRLAVDSVGSLFVVDRAAGGITVLRLEDGRPMYHLPMADATAVAVDWADRLLVGTSRGTSVRGRDGALIRQLDGDAAETSDVAVDHQRRQWLVLKRHSGRVVVYDEAGAVVADIGSTGDAPNQLRSPSGVAVLPDGRIVVADGGHRTIKVFNRDGSLSLAIGGSGGGAGEFVELDDVAVDSRGVIWASDAFQSWVQSFSPDGSLREIAGTYGDGVGEFKTPTGIALAESFGGLVVASLNGSAVQVFQLGPPEPIDWPTAQASVSTQTLEFPPEVVGSTGAPLGFDLFNTGNAPLGVSMVEVHGPYLISGGCQVVAPAAACNFDVFLRPSVPGVQSGEILLHTSADGGPLRIALNGLGFVPAELLVDPPSLEFPPQAVGTSSAIQSVVLSNTGTVGLNLTGISVNGAFASSTQCGAVLAGGNSCAVWVSFSPSDPGAATGVLTISSDLPNSPREVPLSGSGDLLELSPQPSAVDFGYVDPGMASPAESIQVLNTGTARIDVDEMFLEGDHPSDFEVVTDQCSGNQVDVGQACWLQVSFTPGDVGIRQARLIIPISTGFEFAVELIGGESFIFVDGFETGDMSAWTSSTASKSIRVTPIEVSFGEVELGYDGGLAIVTMANATEEPVWVGRLNVVGDHAMEFVIRDDDCSSTWIEIGDSCRFTVTMVTLGEGDFTAVVEIPTPAVGDISPDPVTLEGTVWLP